MRKITSDERMLQNLVVEYEKMADPRLPACSRKAGSLLETCCTIMDLKGVGLSKAGQVYGFVGKASGISQNYYPERLGKLYLINAPWGFSGVFAVIKRFLDPVTVNKIHVLGSNYKSELLGQVPKENLPKEFGGECACKGGCQLSDEGPCKCKSGSGVVKCVLTVLCRARSQVGQASGLREHSGNGKPYRRRHASRCSTGGSFWAAADRPNGTCTAIDMTDPGKYLILESEASETHGRSLGGKCMASGLCSRGT